MKNTNIEEMIDNEINLGIELNNAEAVIARNYNQTVKHFKSDYLVINELLWERDLVDFIEALKKLNIKEFIMADESTALMKTLHFFMKQGFQIKEPIDVEIEDHSYLKLTNESKKGLLIKVQ